MDFSKINRINEPATVARAKYMLSKYQQFHRIEMRETILLKSPSLSGMPRGDSNENNADENIIKNIDAKMYCELCRNTIEALDSDDYRIILNMSFIKPVYNNALIIDSIGINRTAFYEHVRDDALLAYAETCPGMPDIDFCNNGKMIDLIVWN